MQRAAAVVVSAGDISAADAIDSAVVASTITTSSGNDDGTSTALSAVPSANGDGNSTTGTALSTMIDWLSQAALLPLSATLALTNSTDTTSTTGITATTGCAKLTHRTMPSSTTSSSSTLFSSSHPANHTATSLTPTPTCCPFLVIHGDWQWPENNTNEEAFVQSVEKGRALHLKVTDSGHHSYSDIGLLAPPVFAGE